MKLFPVWMSELRVGGICVLEHTRCQWQVNQTDPLGMTVRQLTALVNGIGHGKWNVIETLEGGPKVGQCWKPEGYEAIYPVIKKYA